MGKIRTGSIQVEGLTELQRALKELGGDLPKGLQQANKKVATTVADAARGNAAGAGGVLAHIAPSIKPSAGQKSASVGLGGPAYPMAGGAEFGGRARPTTQQFQPWRGNGSSAGYALYPAIRSEAPRIEPEYRKALEDLIRKANLD